MNIKHKGFTLIELLVVIAIIGVLSVVVLAALGSARNKGNDAAIQSNMRSLLTQVEVYYNSVGNYSYGTQAWLNPCIAAGTTAGALNDSTVEKALTATDAANGSGVIACASNSTSYVAVAQLANDTTKYWCVDSKGVSKQVSTAPGTTLVGAGTYLVGGLYGCYNN